MRNRTFRFVAASAAFMFVAGFARAAEIDWRTKGAVTPVKDQGTTTFDPSWAFAVTGAIEGHTQIATGALSNLSEQELIDCVPAIGDCGDSSCGQAPCGLNFAVNQGLCKTTDYPYTARPGACKNTCVPVAHTTIPGWTRLSGEDGILAALQIGPVIARLKVGDNGAPAAAYANYTSGILMPPPTDDTVHQWVLIVGTAGTGCADNCWTIKNSIGTAWGLAGYLTLVRGVNAFGVADDAYAISDDTAHGACALPDGSCQDLTAADCSAAGGIYGGDLSFCPASCNTCLGETTPPVISATATPRPTKKGSSLLTLTVAGIATDNCAVDISSAQYWVTDSYSPGGPVLSGPVTMGFDGSFSFPVSLTATRTGKRSHLYKIFVSVKDLAGNTATVTIAVPIT